MSFEDPLSGRWLVRWQLEQTGLGHIEEPGELAPELIGDKPIVVGVQSHTSTTFGSGYSFENLPGVNKEL